MRGADLLLRRDPHLREGGVKGSMVEFIWGLKLNRGDFDDVLGYLTQRQTGTGKEDGDIAVKDKTAFVF